MTRLRSAYFVGKTQISVAVGLFSQAHQFFQRRTLQLLAWKYLKLLDCSDHGGKKALVPKQRGALQSIVLTSAGAFLPVCWAL